MNGRSGARRETVKQKQGSARKQRQREDDHTDYSKFFLQFIRKVLVKRSFYQKLFVISQSDWANLLLLIRV